jgi:hypothetical protein
MLIIFYFFPLILWINVYLIYFFENKHKIVNKKIKVIIFTKLIYGTLYFYSCIC